MRGEGRRLGGASIQLLTRGEGWPMVAHGAAVPPRGDGGSTKRRRETIPSVGQSGPNGLATWAGSRENGRKLQEGMGNGLQKSFLDLNEGFEFKDSNTIRLKFELRPN
jgi:hypothetical protein